MLDCCYKKQSRTSRQATRYNARMVRQAHHEREKVAHPEQVEGHERKVSHEHAASFEEFYL